jgi:signal transduction histidine kinase
MTSVARDITGSDLSRRISLQGPDDELRRLADTFDAMLDRLQTAFEDQRRFVQDASHELRNPLAVARTNLELALSDPDADSESLRHSVEIAHRSTGRMSHLVEDLLVQARSGVPAIETIDIDLMAVCEDVQQQFLSPAAERSIELRLDGPGHGSAVVKGDEMALNRVVTNLVSNALRFSPPHSEVEISVASIDCHVELKVADKGPGLSAEDQTQVFTRFWRGKNAGTGSGLGLSIVKQVVERHGGVVSVRSRLGHGSTFVVRLPAASGSRSKGMPVRSGLFDQPTSQRPISPSQSGGFAPLPKGEADGSMTAATTDLATLKAEPAPSPSPRHLLDDPATKQGDDR